MLNVIDKKDLREYLANQLRMLHQEAEGLIDTLEIAIVQGGIGQLETLWVEYIDGTPPNKLDLFKKDIKNAN